MGAAERMREFEPPAWAPHPAVKTSIVKMQVGCNWAQVLEGAIDSAHSSSLHATDMVPAQVDGAGATASEWLRPSTDKAPRLQVQRTDFGFRYVAIRRPIRDADTHDYLRITLFVAPFTVLIPPNDRYQLVDPQHPARRHSHHVLLHRLERGGRHRSGRVAEVLRGGVGVDLDDDFRPFRTRATATCRIATR